MPKALPAKTLTAIGRAKKTGGGGVRILVKKGSHLQRGEKHHRIQSKKRVVVIT